MSGLRHRGSTHEEVIFSNGFNNLHIDCSKNNVSIINYQLVGIIYLIKLIKSSKHSCSILVVTNLKEIPICCNVDSKRKQILYFV